MRIGIDVSCWVNERGYGRYTRELLWALAPRAGEHEMVCFADPWAAERFDLKAPNLRLAQVAQSAAPARAAAADGSRALGDMLRLTRAVWRERLDVFLSPSVYTYFPLPPRLPAAVVIHDAIAERFPRLTLPSRRARWFWRAKVRLALWQARRVLTVSDFAADELHEVLRVPRDRLRVTLEAPAGAYRPSESREEIASAAARAGLPPGATWLTYVGGFNPHKNVDVLIAAHGELAREVGAAAPHLLLVGPVGEDVFHQGLDEVRAAVERAGTGELVRWTGYLADEELRYLHSGAIALVLPSACEGFGLPAVEAAACGAPVVATTASPLPQILEGGGLFVEPGNVGALTAALRRLQGDPEEREVMGRRARERAGRLSWGHAAEVVLRTLDEVAGGSPATGSSATEEPARRPRTR